METSLSKVMIVFLAFISSKPKLLSNPTERIIQVLSSAAIYWKCWISYHKHSSKDRYALIAANDELSCRAESVSEITIRK